MKYIDNFLNSITMYRVVLYGLTFLALLSIVFTFFGLNADKTMFLPQIYSLVLLILFCWGLNLIFAKIFNAHRNVESSYITAYILFFILSFPENFHGVVVTFLASLIAMLSKYVFALYKKHIFNPVAISIVILGFLGIGSAVWWVATPLLLIPVAIVGFLILRKIKRFSLFISFALTSVLILLSRNVISNGFSVIGLLDSFKSIIFSWPIVFLGTIMLTEPTTTPPKRSLQIIYGILVGILFSIQFRFGFIYATPGLALVIGNIFVYFVSPKKRLILTLKEKNKVSSDIYDFAFTPDQKMDFQPGQYLEWTLDHGKTDSRGNRRYFTIASSPTEALIHLGVKYSPKPSSFKANLEQLNIGNTVSASQLAGEFVLPKDPNKKLVFIAGGIGVTPFRSMIKYLIDKKEKRDMTIFYSNKFIENIVYRDIFDQAERELGLKFVYFVSDEAVPQNESKIKAGMLNSDILKQEVPDYLDRTFYISGPHGMVEAFKDSLNKIGVKKTNIKTDLFPGFA